MRPGQPRARELLLVGAPQRQTGIPGALLEELPSYRGGLRHKRQDLHLGMRGLGRFRCRGLQGEVQGSWPDRGWNGAAVRKRAVRPLGR